MEVNGELMGYKGIITEEGIFVDADNAFTYAMERIHSDIMLEEAYRKAVEEWFFSGDFVKTYKIGGNLANGRT